MISASVIEHSQLEEVYIFFDAATYDEVERDVKVNSCLSLVNLTETSLMRFFSKVTMEAQLGLVGGTMGLLTGFSILSAVEITYFLVRFLLCSTSN